MYWRSAAAASLWVYYSHDMGMIQAGPNSVSKQRRRQQEGYVERPGSETSWRFCWIPFMALDTTKDAGPADNIIQLACGCSRQSCPDTISTRIDDVDDTFFVVTAKPDLACNDPIGSWKQYYRTQYPALSKLARDTLMLLG